MKLIYYFQFHEIQYFSRALKTLYNKPGVGERRKRRYLKLEFKLGKNSEQDAGGDGIQLVNQVIETPRKVAI